MTPLVNKREGDKDKDSSSRTTRLPGWAGIEQYAMDHDTAKMRDYAEDIDTLLVFAALFSAILTTFVVQTYQLLQQADSSVTNQLIAYQISSQGNNSNMPPVIASTVSSLLGAPSFAPSLLSRWINVLFFFSLVISLAAALFGIMAKQWIREYMKWNAPLASPRRNILIRQIRFENWEKWNVDAFIWSIPSLLELAMVLFLIGVVLLLWTLDSAVAVAITALVSCFLFVVSVITILPIFFKHCPFRSPTAWAFVRMWDALLYVLLETLRSISRRLGVSSRHIPEFYFRAYRDSWRAKDAPKLLFLGRSVRDAIELEIARESTHLIHGAVSSHFAEEPQLEVSRSSSSSRSGCVRREVLMVILYERSTLLRALAWVSRLSHLEDTQVPHCIQQSMNTIHEMTGDIMGVSITARGRSQEQVLDEGALMTWCLVTTYSRSEGLTQADLPARTNSMTSPYSITQMRKCLGLTAERDLESGAWVFRTTADFSPLSQSCFSGDRVLLRYLAAELQWLVAVDSWLTNDKQVRRVFEVLAILAHSMYFGSYSFSPSIRAPFDVDESLHGLRAVLKISIADQLGLRAPGLRSLALWLAIGSTRVNRSPQDGGYEVHVGLTTSAELETIFIGCLELKEIEQCDEDEINILVMTGCTWLSSEILQLLPTPSESEALSFWDTRARITRMTGRALMEAWKRNAFAIRTAIIPGDLWNHIPEVFTADIGLEFPRAWAELLHVIEKLHYQRAFGYDSFLGFDLTDSLRKIHTLVSCENVGCFYSSWSRVCQDSPLPQTVASLDDGDNCREAEETTGSPPFVPSQIPDAGTDAAVAGEEDVMVASLSPILDDDASTGTPVISGLQSTEGRGQPSE